MITLPQINNVIYKLFLLSIFFVYYQTKFIPGGTVHSWLMFFGLMFTLPILIKKYVGADIKLPLDYLLVLILILVIALGFFVNFTTTDWISFQAYISMLLTYLYVKENTTADTLVFLASVIKYFLLVNGILMILQLFTGSYFPARLFAAGEPPLVIASGVSDGPTKNGMLISFALSFTFARLLFRKIYFSLFDTFIFFVGIISLLASASRAALFSFGLVVIVGSLFALIQAIRKKQYQLNFSNIAIVTLVIGLALAGILQYALSFERLYDFRDNAEHYGLDVILYKMTIFNDDSVDERYGTIAFFMKQLVESPLQYLSVGFGTGTFEQIYGLNIHNSYLELLFTTGFLGFFLFLILVGYVVLKAFSKLNVLEVFPVLFALGSISVFMSVHDVLRGRIFWIALGTLAAFSYSHSRRGQFVVFSDVPAIDKNRSKLKRL